MAFHGFCSIDLCSSCLLQLKGPGALKTGHRMAKTGDKAEHVTRPVRLRFALDLVLKASNVHLCV